MRSTTLAARSINTIHYLHSRGTVEHWVHSLCDVVFKETVDASCVVTLVGQL